MELSFVNLSTIHFEIVAGFWKLFIWAKSSEFLPKLIFILIEDQKII